MKIYDYPGFPNPLRVRIALAEKGLTDHVAFETVDVPAGAHKKPDFLAKNPSGAVPVLELDDGTMIAECTAITEFLDHQDGDQTLTGRDAKERAVIHMMQRRAEDGVLDAVAAYFHQATDGLGPEIEGEQCPEWGHRQRNKAVDGMRYLDKVLRTRDYIAGDRFTVADITAFAGLAFAGFAKIDVPAELDALKAWQDRVAARPSIAA